MKRLLLSASALLFVHVLAAQDLTVPLYPSGAVPNYVASGERERRDSSDIHYVSLVQTPEVAVYLPSKRSATGTAVIICPGGGYGRLAYSWEGTDPARFFASRGIAAIVLKYRLPNSKSVTVRHETPLLDAQRAIRLVRANAARWNIRPDRIGIMGFSAGGHLASTALTRFDAGDVASGDSVARQSARPDFGVLVYPVITLSKPVLHKGSRDNLLGTPTDTALTLRYSSELQVTRETPPVFLVHALDDKSVPMENSLLFFTALKDNGVSGELHVFPKGGHGFGMGTGKGAAEGWTTLCLEWMRGLYQQTH
ncbi:alpha/beta hydrolase [Flaviaesturariibacter amylovorans]|uniref:BD-FAE-like domain-containing protein n=1 Tax=Flaviaesturariibacter amylovorans TaxID=1084520 RepID=A0ABP8GZY1_9BACT